MQDLRRRATALEEAVAGTNRRLDRIEERVERIERRLCCSALHLVEAP